MPVTLLIHETVVVKSVTVGVNVFLFDKLDSDYFLHHVRWCCCCPIELVFGRHYGQLVLMSGTNPLT